MVWAEITLYFFSVACHETGDWVCDVGFYASALAAACDLASFLSARGEVGLFLVLPCSLLLLWLWLWLVRSLSVTLTLWFWLLRSALFREFLVV